jgi:DNA-directed RNA polymerase subunit RPC12/RpoP
MKIEFKCEGCRKPFECDVGEVGMAPDGMRPTFEKDIVCPRCGKRTMDNVLPTERGQGQLAEATRGM